MGKQYGDVLFFHGLGKSLLVLSSIEATNDLLDKRSAIYANRPYSIMLHELWGVEWAIPAMNYTDRWRDTRRVFHRHFSPSAIGVAQSSIIETTQKLLTRLHEAPEGFLDHTRLHSGSTAMKVIYGHEIVNRQNEYVAAAEVALTGFAGVTQFGNYYVEFLPFLKYVPSWFPGAQFKRDAARWRSCSDALWINPFKAAKAAMVSGTAPPSIVRDMLTAVADGSQPADEEGLMQDSVAVAYLGASDPIASTLQSFLLAMVLYPDVQRTAQEQLDKIVGRDRLPNFNDRDALPYIIAIIKETLRWHPTSTMGQGYSTGADDVYRGWFIPKGTVVLGNAWSLLRDPLAWEDPTNFVPSRFLTATGELNPDALDPSIASFGFGRRSCPGRYLAYDLLYYTCASILHSFEITPALDAEGKPIPVKAELTTGTISFPEEFKCSFKPRSGFSDFLPL